VEQQNDQNDFGEKQKRHKFSRGFLNTVAEAPYLDPTKLVVAGDQTTEEGKALAGTFLDDGRANLPWSEDHERIVIGLLTGSTLVPMVQRVGANDVPPVGWTKGDVGTYGGVEKTAYRKSVMITDGAPVLVFYQGDDDNHTVVAHDGRQRRRAAIELNRRLDWLSSLLDKITDGKISKPKRRNTLIKIGHAHAKGADWDTIVSDDKIELPKDAAPYYSPEVGYSLNWLNDTFAKAVTGSEDLGEQGKKGWLYVEKDADGNPAHVRSYDAWLKISVCGTNVDPTDPFTLLGNITAKEAQVKTPPSLLAEQIDRIISARMNPNDPNSEPLYSREAVREKFKMAEGTLENYQLIRGLCAEVAALLDSGEMSINFAVGGRESPFVTWPAKAKRTVIPFDKQRLILDHLLLKLSADGTGDKVRFKGPAALAEGKKIRDAVLSGKLGPVGEKVEDGEDETAEAVVSGASPTVTPAKPKPAAEPKRRRLAVDLATFRTSIGQALERANAAVTAADEQNDYTAQAKAAQEVSALSLAQSLALVLAGTEPLSALDTWPTVRDALAASLPADAPAGPKEIDLIHDWISASVEEMILNNQDTPKVSTATNSNGRTPTEEQVEKCNTLIAGWVTDFNADQSATMLDTYIMSRITSQQSAA
jgi:hypothetical protein